MKVFIAGTVTDIGKTTVCSWLCLHTRSSYFKPIQAGTNTLTDNQIVSNIIGDNMVHKETYCLKHPLSPHLAASLENIEIKLNNIQLPQADDLIVEGAGGLLVPINSTALIVDLVSTLKLPVILIARSRLGTINHTLLSIEALRSRAIPLMGVIMNGKLNQNNVDAIERYGKVKVLACFPECAHLSKSALKAMPLTKELEEIFGIKK